MSMNVRFPKVHHINSVNPSFSDMCDGHKNFEVLFDPDIKKKYMVGDTIIFTEYDYMMKATGRILKFKINYIFVPEYLLQGFIIASLIRL